MNRTFLSFGGLGIAQKRPEMVPAALDARLARQLRNCCPHLLFCNLDREVSYPLVNIQKAMENHHF